MTKRENLTFDLHPLSPFIRVHLRFPFFQCKKHKAHAFARALGLLGSKARVTGPITAGMIRTHDRRLEPSRPRSPKRPWHVQVRVRPGLISWVALPSDRTSLASFRIRRSFLPAHGFRTGSRRFETRLCILLAESASSRASTESVRTPISNFTDPSDALSRVHLCGSPVVPTGGCLGVRTCVRVDSFRGSSGPHARPRSTERYFTAVCQACNRFLKLCTSGEEVVAQEMIAREFGPTTPLHSRCG